MKLEKRRRIETPGGNQETVMVQDEVRFKFKNIFQYKIIFTLRD